MNPERKLVKIYHPIWEKFSREDFNESAKLFTERLRGHIDFSWFKGKTCLDAGCGTGRYTKALLNLGVKKVYAYDLDTKIAERFLQDPRVKFDTGDLRNMPYLDEWFDFVVCNGVLHHTQNPDIIMAEIKRVMKKESLLFFYVFGMGKEWKIIDKFRGFVRDIPVKEVTEFIKNNLDAQPRTLAHFIDLMYAPIQRKYSEEELYRLLSGFMIKVLPGEEWRILAKKG